MKNSEQNWKHAYMMLSRYKHDLLYFWGYGNMCEKHLYWGDYKTHIKEIIKLWKKLPEKPIWFRATEIIEFKNKIKSKPKISDLPMCGECLSADISKNGFYDYCNKCEELTITIFNTL